MPVGLNTLVSREYYVTCGNKENAQLDNCMSHGCSSCDCTCIDRLGESHALLMKIN